MPKEISCTVSFEALAHFQCGNEACGKWWSIGDAPVDKVKWACPWCFEVQEVLLPKFEELKIVSGVGKIVQILNRPDLFTGDSQ